MRKLNIIILLASALLFNACGFLNDTPVEESNIYKSEELNGCTINPEKISQIFIENIEDQIVCLEESLRQFRYVQVQNRDVLTKGELTLFIKEFFEKNSETIIQGLSLVFELNMLMLRDEANQISKENISPLFKLLSNVNREAVIILKTFEDMQKKELRLDFWKNREKLAGAVKRFSDETLKLIELGHKTPKTIDLNAFIFKLQNDLAGKPINEKTIDSLLFIKKLFLGGSRRFITSSQLVDLVYKAPTLLMSAFDMILISKDNFTNKFEYHDFLISKVDDIEGTLYQQKDNEHIFDIDDLFNIAEQINLDEIQNDQGDSFKLKEYEKVIESLKKDLIGGHKRRFIFKDLKTIFTYTRLGLKAYQRYLQVDELTKDIKSKSDDDILAARAKVYKLAKDFPQDIETLIRNTKNIPEVLSPLTFIETLNNETTTFNFDMEVVNALFSVKQLTLGGLRHIVTRDEVLKVVGKTRELVELYFDIRYVLPIYEKKSDIRTLLLSQLSKIESLLIEREEDFDILTSKEAGKIVEFFFEDKDDQQKYTNLLNSFKSHILGGSPTVYSFFEFKQALDYVNLLVHGDTFVEKAGDFFDKYDKKERDANAEILLKSIDQLSKEVISLINKGYILNNDIDLVSLFKDAGETINMKPEDIQLIEDLFPIKALFAGGQPSKLSKKDALKLLSKVGKMVKLALSIMATERDDFKTTAEFNLKIYSYIRTVDTLFENIQPQTKLFGVKGVLRTLERFIDFNFVNLKRTVVDVKERLLELRPRELLSYDATNPDLPPNNDMIDSIFSKKEIDRLIVLAMEGFETLIFNDVTYQHFAPTLDVSKKTLKNLQFPKLPEYEKLRPEYLTKLKKNFSKIASHYRYFREKESGMQHYTYSVNRNKYGYEELAFLRWGLGKALIAYGPYETNEEEALKNSISIDQLSSVLVGIRSILEEFSLWTSDFTLFARNTLLLGDLFQSQSNGDMSLNQEEATEYVALILQAVKLASDVVDKMQVICPYTLDKNDDPLIDPICHRKNLFKVIFDDLNYGDYFPRLRLYSKWNSDQDDIEFIKSIEGFARDIPMEEPMRIRDFSLVLGAMLNIESTFLRFDRNQDNVIDRDELEKAYEVYENVILMLAPELNEGGNRKYAKTVFFYMLKYNKIPCSKATIAKHHYGFWFYYRNFEAKRVNIGSLLYYLVNGASCSDEGDDDDLPSPPDEELRR
ncbi:hypothetical protein HBN50_03245 [Halobacteriovorax sp. GB3]|uniref:hypothetical protein n=1 Tax=Halobacteriovorax sp. GB3 TaxID=2719615 RepID=UPI002362A6B8|nr:hypothetical protein [Halobacteriovorax sp. GB3]MDD0852092.1 hypothetical protein [Halobacteriovorax sp. GB3]